MYKMRNQVISRFAIDLVLAEYCRLRLSVYKKARIAIDLTLPCRIDSFYLENYNYMVWHRGRISPNFAGQYALMCLHASG